MHRQLATRTRLPSYFLMSSVPRNWNVIHSLRHSWNTPPVLLRRPYSFSKHVCRPRHSLATCTHMRHVHETSGAIPYMMSGALHVAGGLAQIYGILVLVVFFLQRKLIFLPPAHVVDPRSQGGDPLVLVRPSSEGAGQNAAIFYKPQHADDCPVFVYFHGNADQLGWGPALLGKYFTNQYGMGFYGIEYPGYGLARPGKPSEKSIFEAAESLLLELDNLGVARSRVVLFGQSIGCAVAVEMARRGHGSKLVLLSPFTSMAEVAGSIYPFLTPALKVAPYLVRDSFDNRAKAPDIDMPTLVVHGTNDEIVPFWMGKELAKLSPRADFLPVSGMGHNDVFSNGDVLAAIASFAQASPPK